jgi:hypothetical protein
VLLPPNDPESKFVAERRNGWFENSFMPGRSFRSAEDFNTQFTDWLSTANTRVVRTVGAAPTDRLTRDLAAMLPLPPIPLHLGWRNRIRLGRDYYVRLDTNDYSVDPSVIGRLVDVTADLGSLQVGDKINERPSGAGRAVRKRSTNGWTFWVVDAGNGIRLDDLRSQYSVQLGVEVDNDDEQETPPLG